MREVFHFVVSQFGEPLAFEQCAVEFLRDRGWVVQKAYDWETPAEICHRLGITWKILSARIASPIRPHVEVIRGKRRLQYVASNSIFDAFCIGNQPEKMNQKIRKTGKETNQ